MAGTYTRWYREGTVNLVQGSTAVTGTNTYWLTAGLNPGDIFSIDGVTDFEILAISDNTHITLKSAYTGTSINGTAYHIIRNFTAHMPSQIAAQTAELYGDLIRYWDQDTQSIHGKSAYEIAKLHGYTDTEEKWLESLKGAGEITAINTKLSRIYTNNAMAHNAVPRGANLGTSITAAQMQAIRNGTFDNLYIGDYWNLPIDGTTTAIITAFGLNPCHVEVNGTGCPSNNICLWLQNNNWKYPINDTATCEGHLKGSKLYTETFPMLLEKIKAVIPSEYIGSISDHIYDNIDSNGNVNHSVLETMQLFLPSAVNLNILHTKYPNNGLHIVTQNVWPYFTYNITTPRVTYWTCHSYNKTSWYAKAAQNAFLWCLGPENRLNCWPYIFLA